MAGQKQFCAARAAFDYETGEKGPGPAAYFRPLFALANTFQNGKARCTLSRSRFPVIGRTIASDSTGAFPSTRCLDIVNDWYGMSIDPSVRYP
jgi:hypothetical protein